MDTWVIVAIAVVVLAIVYFMMRKKTVAGPPSLVATNIQTAPGVIPSSGTIPPNPAPPAPEQAAGVAKSGIAHFVGVASLGASLGIPNPAVLSHIPIVGGAAAAAVRAPVALANTALNEASNVLSQVPIAGKIAAAPVKIASKVLSSAASFFGF